MCMRMLIYTVILCTLLGCSNLEVNKLSRNSIESNMIATETSDEKPPALILTIGGDVIKTYSGTYSWHYLDKKTGQDVIINVDHAAPTQIVKIEQGIEVNFSKPVNLSFAKDPTSYEVNIWNSDELIATYKSFEEVKEQGKFIVEIIGTWGKSTASYVAALHITNL